MNMETMFNDIQKTLGQVMAGIVTLVDEDCGQLEALHSGLDQYPVTFPCILISTPEVQWQDFKGGVQRGRAQVRIRLAFDCYEDTRLGSGQEHAATWRMRQAEIVNSALHMQQPDGSAGPMKRTYSRHYSLPYGIKVYETDYEVSV